MLCAPSGLSHRDLVYLAVPGLAVQELIHFAQRRLREIEAHAFHTYISSGAGSKTFACLMSGRCASERNSEAIAT
jgi:hypothetical protein